MRSATAPAGTAAPAPEGRPRRPRRRALAFAALCLLAAVLGAGYTIRAAGRIDLAGRAAVAPPAAADPAAVAAAPHLVFRTTSVDAQGAVGLAPLDRPEAARARTGTLCDVVYAAAGRGVCLQSERGVLTTYRATLLDAELRPGQSYPLNGIPSRARVSPDGRLAAHTVFVSGHSYAVFGFSTETAIVDAATGEKVVANLEEMTVLREGRPLRAADLNFWGVTFARDGRRFYVTLSTGGRTFLGEGDLDRREVRVLRENVECPSLSPDGARIAFKKRVDDGIGPVRWRLSVLDLATLADTPLAETRNVDDQAEWLDGSTVAYTLPREGAAPVTDVWAVPADGSGTPRLLLEGASSPAAVRG